MKKKKKILNRVKYEENPWPDDPPGVMVPVKDFLPPPHVLKKAKVRYIDAADDLPLHKDDAKTLRKHARKVRLTPRALIAAIVHDYLHGPRA